MTLSSMAVGGVAKSMIAVTISLHPAAAHHGSHYITVQPGNTLSSISARELGSAADWPALWWANRHSVHNPAMIAAGQRLRLPRHVKVPASLARAAQTAVSGAQPAAAPAAAPAGATAVASTPQPAAVYGGGGGFQSCVIAAESGGNAGAVNPYSGAGGLYGFLPSTWQALGFSGLPQNASVATQNAAFAREYAQSGASAWAPYDGC
jgi:resuscitation-promoting factor RpfC